MHFNEQLLAFISYGWKGYTIGRLTSWWPAGLREAESPVLGDSLTRLEAMGHVEAYRPAAGAHPRSGLQTQVLLAELSQPEFASLLGPDARWPLRLVASIGLQNQIELANPSREAREQAATFADPEYAPESQWGDASLWPNRLAREISRRVNIASDSRDTSIDFNQIRVDYERYANSAVGSNGSQRLESIDLCDVLYGLLWRDDAPLLGSFLHTLNAHGIILPSSEFSDWTIDTLISLPIYRTWVPSR